MTHPDPGFITGGAVPLDSGSYVDRPFEDDLFGAVTAGDWVMLMGPRQHGKSSALTRLFVKLTDSGFHCALVDLQAYGAEASYDDFLVWLSARIARDVGSEPVDSAGSEDLETVLRETLPEELANIVVILDEVSAVPEACRRRFFGQLRALFNARGRSPRDDLTWRVNFVFAGTFRPEQMIEGDNSPFNVSQFLATTDLSRDQVRELASRVGGEELAGSADAIYERVGGQPYLVQVALAAAERLASEGSPDLVQPTIDRLLAGDDRHVTNLVRQVRGDPQLLAIIPRILAQDLDFDGGNDDHHFALVVGVAAVNDGVLAARNELYRQVLSHVVDVDAEEEQPDAGPLCDVLLVTANSIETASTREVFAGPGEPIPGETNSYVDLGLFGGSRVMLVRCQGMGTTGVGASQLVVHEAISELKPSAIVVLGVAFGFLPDEQPIGTIMVADRVVAYGPEKVATQPGGGELRIARGQQFNLQPGLLGRLQEAEAQHEDGVEFGTVLSGDKLIDNVEFRDQLLETAPEARGGEMEAAGACAAAERAGIPWAVVKAVCDYADGNKDASKDFNQKLAADKAAEFVRFTLEGGAFERG